jgi:hypothetical protein
MINFKKFVVIKKFALWAFFGNFFLTFSPKNSIIFNECKDTHRFAANLIVINFRERDFSKRIYFTVLRCLKRWTISKKTSLMSLNTGLANE